MCQRISRETGRQGGLPVFIWFSLLLGVVLFWVGAGIEKDGAAGCGSVCGVALSGAGAKKCTGSFAACAAGGVGRKAGWTDCPKGCGQVGFDICSPFKL